MVNDTRQGLIEHGAPAMYQDCHGHSGYGGRYGGMVSLDAAGKRMTPVRSQILPSPILSPEVTSTKNPCSLDDFLVVEMFINEGL